MAWIEESVGPSSSSSRVHYIPLCSNTLEEHMNPSLLPPHLTAKTGFYSLE